MWQDGLGAQEHRFQVDREGVIEISLGQIIKSAVQGQASVVDEDVYGLELPFHRRHHPLHRRAIRDVGPHRDGLPTERSDRNDDRVRFLLALPVVHGNVGTRLG